MSRLKIAAVTIPLATYLFFGWAAYRQLPIAAYWWVSCGAATAVGFALFRVSQRPEFGGDGGAAEQQFISGWVPLVAGFGMLLLGCFLAVWSLVSRFGDPWDAFAGACVALVGGAVGIRALRQRWA